MDGGRIWPRGGGRGRLTGRRGPSPLVSTLRNPCPPPPPKHPPSSDSAAKAKATETMEALKAAGEPFDPSYWFVAGYDSPYTLINRHNEVRHNEGDRPRFRPIWPLLTAARARVAGARRGAGQGICNGGAGPRAGSAGTPEPRRSCKGQAHRASLLSAANRSPPRRRRPAGVDPQEAVRTGAAR